ncbi:hypothetical protein WCE34_14255 [Luteimonas sp. MJ204]|uniref:hypothetical protein n=1 Tax=Luteimonas sp. MJ145 TaxID=3129234 RepID=UPI0031BB97B3
MAGKACHVFRFTTLLGLTLVLGPTEAPVRIILAAALISVALPAMAQAPEIPMQEAIRLAEQYIQNNQIENDHRYLDSAKWHFDHEEPEKSCWSLMWDVPASPPITDSHLLVNVCVNGRTWHHDDWA